MDLSSAPPGGSLRPPRLFPPSRRLLRTRHGASSPHPVTIQVGDYDPLAPVVIVGPVPSGDYDPRAPSEHVPMVDYDPQAPPVTVTEDYDLIAPLILTVDRRPPSIVRTSSEGLSAVGVIGIICGIVAVLVVVQALVAFVIRPIRIRRAPSAARSDWGVSRTPSTACSDWGVSSSDDGGADVVEQELEMSWHGYPPGLPTHHIAALPRAPYPPPRLSGQRSPDQMCVVCREEFSIGETVAVFPCSHLFHGPCATGTLSGRGACPLCNWVFPRTTDARDGP